jgi:diguanylate cyclase (GGDEF)-like protein/PAS domain S-box-containing protein
VGACIYLKDLEGKYLFVNRQVLATWGVEREDIIGQGDERLFEGDSVARIRENDRKVLSTGIVEEREEVETIRSSGKTSVFWSVKIPLYDAEGKVYALCGISTDITEHRDNRDRIRFLSHYDTLTGLPNRELLHERTRLAVTAAAASGTPLALLYIDLDRFQLINESLGLAVGDAVLTALSSRLSAELNLESTLSRMGGDEFFLLLPGVGEAGAAQVAERLLSRIAEPLQLEAQRLSVTASIGIACFPEHGRDLDQLTQAADAALSRAKLAGRNVFCVFEDEMRVHANETLQIENQLREALVRGDLSLHYQPQVSLSTGEITGVEALIRWQHPELGFVPPSRFIPIAEESGLILDIGSWVLRTAIAQQALWQAAGLPVGPVAVNLSAMQIYREDFAEMVSQMLADAGVPAQLLDLELTERIAMESSGKTLATLGDLHRRGVVLSIDDFGTGYSSLSYLKRYPVQKLKIDKSFVDGVAEDAEDQAIALAIIGVARGLGFRTIAEGVETEAQWQFLKDNGCDEFQGYYFSKPLPAADFEALLRELTS